MKLIGYARVSTPDQEDSLLQQEVALHRAAAYAGHEVVDVVREVASAASMKRPAFQSVLARIRKGEADGLVVTRLDRMSRSVYDAAGLFRRSEKQGWAIVMLDPAVDTSTPYGRAFASVAAVFAQLERDLISQRTKEALAEKRRQGVRLGRAPEMDPLLDERIFAMVQAGLTIPEVVDVLEAEGVPTARGGQWRYNTVRTAYRRHARSQVAPVP